MVFRVITKKLGAGLREKRGGGKALRKMKGFGRNRYDEELWGYSWLEEKHSRPGDREIKPVRNRPCIDITRTQ